MLFRIQAADAPLINNHKPSTFDGNSVYGHTRARSNELYIRHLEQAKDKLSTFAQVLGGKIQQKKIIFHSLNSMFNSTMRSFDYDEEDKLKKWKPKAKMWKRHLLLMLNQHFSHP